MVPEVVLPEEGRGVPRAFFVVTKILCLILRGMHYLGVAVQVGLSFEYFSTAMICALETLGLWEGNIALWKRVIPLDLIAVLLVIPLDLIAVLLVLPIVLVAALIVIRFLVRFALRVERWESKERKLLLMAAHVALVLLL
jgi:hypothetical protein